MSLLWYGPVLLSVGSLELVKSIVHPVQLVKLVNKSPPCDCILGFCKRLLVAWVAEEELTPCHFSSDTHAQQTELRFSLDVNRRLDYQR